MVTKLERREALMRSEVECPMCEAKVVYREFTGHYYTVHADLPKRYEKLHDMLREHYR